MQEMPNTQNLKGIKNGSAHGPIKGGRHAPSISSDDDDDGRPYDGRAGAGAAEIAIRHHP